jgi:asparagine synthase (glutamine-hydrolysing)
LTGICAFTSDDRDRAVSKVDEMLDAMQARGTVKEPVVSQMMGDRAISIGICHHGNLLGSEIQRSDESVRILDGVFFSKKTEVIPAFSVLDDTASLFSSPAAFAFLGMIRGAVVAARDPLGLKPLYWGSDDNGNYGFASLIAPLRSVGIADPKPVDAGRVIELLDSGPEVSLKQALARPEEIEIEEDEAVERLATLLLEAVSRMVPEDSGLAFSGGVDSALVATACTKVGLKPELITVGMAGQPELQHAKQASKDIGLPITTRPLDEVEVLKAVKTVVQTVETKSPVTLGISLPFHFTCQQAQALGLKAIVMGQLSDELFGGYARFEETALKAGLDEVNSSMWDSVLAAAEGDFAPGDKVATSFDLELRCPFAYLPLAKFALELPVNLRVNVSAGKVVRKYLLRKLAEKWGLPFYIVNRPKKAFQYSSGVQKVLVKEARRSGRRLGELLR